MAKNKKKPNAGKALTAEKREQLYQVFFKHGTMQSVVKQCATSRNTAAKYKKLDKWVERVERTKKKAADKTDNTNAKRLNRNTKLLDNALSVYASSLIGKVKCPHCQGEVTIPKLTPKFGDLEKLMKMELILTGGMEVEETIHIRLTNLPDEFKNT